MRVHAGHAEGQLAAMSSSRQVPEHASLLSGAPRHSGHDCTSILAHICFASSHSNKLSDARAWWCVPCPAMIMALRSVAEDAIKRWGTWYPQEGSASFCQDRKPCLSDTKDACLGQIGGLPAASMPDAIEYGVLQKWSDDFRTGWPGCHCAAREPSASALTRHRLGC
jgi:hypothetical protein